MSNFGPEIANPGARGPFEPRGVQFRNSVDVGGFLSILSRQWFWILVGIAVTFGLAFVYITTAPLTYTSTISILIDARERQPIGSDQAPLPSQADPIMVESQLKLMTSQAVLRRVVIAEHLESDPEFAPSDHVGTISGLLDRGTVLPPAIDQITDNLFNRISVKRPDRTYVVDMDVKASSPGKAARLADAIAKAFIDEEHAAANAYTQDQSDWIVKRTDELRAKVEAAEKKVQDYKAVNGIVDVAGTLTPEQQLQDANRDLAAVHSKAAEAQSRVDQIRRIIASGKALDGTYDTINSTVIRQLRVQYSDLVRREAAASQKYGSRHPEYQDIQQQLQAVKGQINDEMQRISSALTNEAQVARGNEDAAQKRVQILEAKTTDTNQTSLKLRELQRLADGERTNYEKFLRANDSIRRDPTETPYARIVAPASFPGKPSSPKVMAALLIAAAAGISLGVGLAIARDYMAGGSGLKDVSPGAMPLANQASSQGPVGRNGASSLAKLRAAISGRRPLVAQHPQTAATQPDSFVGATGNQIHQPPAAPRQDVAHDARLDPRDLLNGLLGDMANGQVRRIVLTARSASEQKTDLSMSMAKAAAVRGHAILLIDGDNRQSNLSRLATRIGTPARIRFDQMELRVLGIPQVSNGVVFVLPLEAVTGDLSVVETPFVQCHVGAVVVDGPAQGPELAKFTGIADSCYALDDTGYLQKLPVNDAAGNHGSNQEGMNGIDLDPRRFAQQHG